MNNQISLRIVNNTNTAQGITMFGNKIFPNKANEATKIYQYDVSMVAPAFVNTVTIEVKPFGQALITLAIPLDQVYSNFNVGATVSALNASGIGVFSASGALINGYTTVYEALGELDNVFV